MDESLAPEKCNEQMKKSDRLFNSIQWSEENALMEKNVNLCLSLNLISEKQASCIICITRYLGTLS